MIQAVADTGSFYEVTLTSGTIMWVPKDAENSDYVRVEAWVAAGGIVS